MFTGIVEERGEVTAVEKGSSTAHLAVRCELVVSDARIGDSIAVNGCCLTVTGLPGDGFVVDMMGETLDRTSLGALRAGSVVNLERALPADGRLGGHLVQGHVDGVGCVREVRPEGEWTRMTFEVPTDIAPFIAEKGSVTVDGVSLTVTGVGTDWFAVGLIPHTLEVTTLGERHPGDQVNIEVDVLARYVARLGSYAGAKPVEEE